MAAQPSFPAGYPSDWELSVALRDGTSTLIRPILPADADALHGQRGHAPHRLLYRQETFFAHKLPQHPRRQADRSRIAGVAPSAQIELCEALGRIE